MLIAIYSRKSKWTGKGESVENQIIMCREYLTYMLQIKEDAEIREYEDEGFSGKNTKRPMFQQMLKDMEKEHFDYLVCYKLDRLGRNLLDLTTLMDRLEKEHTSFISIKERFDTTTPIGKAMLYFSGVLAQMEREQIAERVRDNMILLARSGRWLGGNTPYGFRAIKIENKTTVGGKKKTFSRLEEIAEELGVVKEIFEEFLTKRSLNKVVNQLKADGKRNRNQNFFTVMGVRDILTNPVYCCCDKTAFDYYCQLGCQVCMDEWEIDGVSGLIAYGKTNSKSYKNQSSEYKDWIVAKALHKGLITGVEFVKVQKILKANKGGEQQCKRGRNQQALCSGLVYCSCGQIMRPKYYPKPSNEPSSEKNPGYFYLCTGKEKSHGETCREKNMNGKWLDEYVWKEVCHRYVGEANVINTTGEDISAHIISEKTEDSGIDRLTSHKEQISDAYKESEETEIYISRNNRKSGNQIYEDIELTNKLGENIYGKRDYLHEKINKIIVQKGKIEIQYKQNL